MRHVQSWLLATLIAPGVVGAQPVVPQRAPQGFQLDGQLDEWRAALPPVVRLGSASHASGPVTPSGEADASLTGWLVLAPDALLVAVDVTDDTVFAPETVSLVSRRDHVELALAFPEAELPPIGFQYISDLEDVQIGDVSWCDSAQAPKVFGAASACRAWVAEQTRRRDALRRLFTRRYLLSAAGVQEVHANGHAPAGEEADLPFAWPDGCDGCAIKTAPHPGGYSIEARLPLGALPATASDPLDSFFFRFDLADADQGDVETVLSSATEPPPDKGGRGSLAALVPPRAFETSPPMAASLIALDDGTFVFPAETLTSAFGFENPQLDDEKPSDVVSPEVVEIPFPEAPAARTPAVSLYVVPQAIEVSSGGATRLAAFRGDTEVASYSFASNCGDYDVTDVFTDDVGACKLVAFVCVGPRNPAGFGPCGACTSIDYEVVAVRGAGEMRAAGQPGSVLCEDEDDDAVVVKATAGGFSLACAGAPSAGTPRSLSVAWSRFRKACAQE